MPLSHFWHLHHHGWLLWNLSPFSPYPTISVSLTPWLQHEACCVQVIGICSSMRASSTLCFQTCPTDFFLRDIPPCMIVFHDFFFPHLPSASYTLYLYPSASYTLYLYSIPSCFLYPRLPTPFLYLIKESLTSSSSSPISRQEKI